MNKKVIFMSTVIVIILVGVLSMFVISGRMNSNKNTDSSDTNYNGSSGNEIQNTEKKITLTGELSKYLSYVPGAITAGIDDEKAYTKSKCTVDEISLEILRNMALYSLNNADFKEKTFDASFSENFIEWPENNVYSYITVDDLNVRLQEMYNKTISGIENGELDIPYMSYYVKDNYILPQGGGNPGVFSHLSAPVDYEMKDDEINIYEYAGYVGYCSKNENEYCIRDYYKKTEVSCNSVSDEDKYFDEHKNDFSKYKHTFKKNKDGYYWYSTEIV